jgi:hypothetical protein
MDLRARLTSLCTMRGKLDGLGYAKRIAIAFALWFAIATPGMALVQSNGAGWPVLVFLLSGIAAGTLWFTLIISSTVRFLRYVKGKYFE